MSNVKRKDLAEKCKALEIKFYGTKQQILDRISIRESELAKTTVQTNIESDNSLNLNMKEDDDDDFDDEPYDDEQDDGDDDINDVPLPSQDIHDSASNKSTAFVIKVQQ